MESLDYALNENFTGVTIRQWFNRFSDSIQAVDEFVKVEWSGGDDVNEEWYPHSNSLAEDYTALICQ